MSVLKSESVKLRKTTREASKNAARQYRTSMATVVEAAVQRFVKLPRATILRDIELYDPRGGPVSEPASPSA